MRGQGGAEGGGERDERGERGERDERGKRGERGVSRRRAVHASVQAGLNRSGRTCSEASLNALDRAV